MDILTQGLLGAGLAAAAAPPAELRTGAACGFAAGLLADADVLIRSSHDPLLVLEFHRHFTHALAFIPIGALLAALVLWPLARRRLTFARLFLYSLLGYCLSGFLDACTSYGTMLLWPFSEERIAWSLISIVDPIFTGTLLVSLLFALRRRRASASRVGLVLGALYLALGAAQHERAREALAVLASERGHAPVRAIVKPTFGNIVLWRGLYEHDGRVYAEALRAGIETTVYPGESAPLVVPTDGHAARFAVFSDGWLVADHRHPGRLGDARYAMLPNSLAPLWGIESGPGGGVRFVNDRTLSRGGRARFLEMLRGTPE